MRRPQSDGGNRRLTGVPVVLTLTLWRSADVLGAASLRPILLSFADLFTIGAPTLELSPVARHLNGRQVRLAGFVARLSRGSRDGFYLCPAPVEPAEAERGPAALPPVAVRVTVPRTATRRLASAPGRVEVVGRLEVGYREDADGGASWIRLTAEGPRRKGDCG